MDNTDGSDIQVGMFLILWPLFVHIFKLLDEFSASLLQCVLEQLVSEYNKLNDALRAEKRLYQNLVQVQNKGDR